MKILRGTAFVLCAACFAVTGTAQTMSAQTIQVNKENRTIAITATDTATTDPDIATVHIGFQVFAPDSDTVYRQGSATSNAIIDALKKAGVAEKAIESEAQSVRRNQQFDLKESEADRANRQFALEQSWTVHTTAADAAKVLHLAVESGANNSGAIDWNVKDRKALQAKAAANALAKAQAIATQMASALNVSMKGLIYASNQAPDQQEERGAMGGVLGSIAGVQLMSRLVAPLAIRPHDIEESATVYAIFSIE